MRTDVWGKVELELVGFDQSVEVGNIDKLAVYVAAFCFCGALCEPTINPGIDFGEDSGDEGGIVCTLGLIGGEIVVGCGDLVGEWCKDVFLLTSYR